MKRPRRTAGRPVRCLAWLRRAWLCLAGLCLLWLSCSHAPEMARDPAGGAIGSAPPRGVAAPADSLRADAPSADSRLVPGAAGPDPRDALGAAGSGEPADSTGRAEHPSTFRGDTLPEMPPDTLPEPFTQPPPMPWNLTGDQLKGRIDGPIDIVNPVLVHEGLELRAKQGRYEPDLQRAELHGDVSIRDSVRVLTAEHAFYHRGQSLLEMEGRVRGRGPEGVFRARRLTYDREQEQLNLSGQAVLTEGARELSGDWVRYSLRDSIMEAGGSLRLYDQADSVEVFGDAIHHDRASGIATIVSDGARRPRLVRAGPPGAAPFVMEADTLMLWGQERRGEASGQIRFSRGAVQGRCERAGLLMENDQLLLTGFPEVGDLDGWVTGDSMTVNLADGDADNVRVWGSARAEYFPLTRRGEAHFAAGDSILALLRGGAIHSALVEGGAQALYLPAPGERDQGVGLNWTRGTRLRLLMGPEGVESVQFQGDVAGRYVLPFAPQERRRYLAEQESLGVTVPGHVDPDSAAGRRVHADAAPRAAAGDSTVIERGPRPALARRDPPGFAPALLAALRGSAAAGDLMPGDSLLIVLGFKPTEKVEYRGRQIDFAVATNLISIREQSQVAYQGMELEAEEILFDSTRDLVTARGHPILRDPGNEVFGERMTYRIDTRQGLVYQGRSEFEGGHYRGEKVKRVREKTFYASDADFTPCECESAMTHFHAKQMKIVSGDKVFAKPVVLYLGHIPLMAIPYAVFPLSRGRQSGILMPDFEFGIDSERGRFLRNVGYYYAPNDYWDGLAWMDYYEADPRLTFNAKLRYKLRYVLGGRAEGSFTRDNSGAVRRDRWLFNADHDQTLGERFAMKLSARFQSDKDYADDRDFGADVDERINRQLRSQFSINKSWSGASLSLAADRTEYLDNSGGATRINQSIPSVNFSLSSFPLGRLPDARGRGATLPALASTYVRADAKLRSEYTKRWDDEVITNQAAAINASLSDKRRILGGVNVTPSASLNAAWAREDRNGEPHPVGATWRAGLSASSTLYGTFFPGLGPWEGLRHVIDLSASYGYRPESESVKDFPSVGGISLSSAKSSSVSLGLTQRFHVKWRKGEETIKKENLLTWSSRTSYDFLAKERDREPWSNMTHSLRLDPARAVSSDLSLTHDMKQWSRSQLSLRSSMQFSGGASQRSGSPAGAAGGPGLGGRTPGSEHVGFGDVGHEGGLTPDRDVMGGSLTGPWRLSATHVFSMGRDWRSHRSSVNLASELTVTQNWRLKYAIYYDLSEQEVSSQSYSVYRDLGCWQAVLDRRVSGGRSSYFFRISVKDLPDLKYERQRR